MRTDHQEQDGDDMAIIRYQGDRTGSLPKVLGGRFKVVEATYDSAADVTLVQVLPLVNPLGLLDNETEEERRAR